MHWGEVLNGVVVFLSLVLTLVSVVLKISFVFQPVILQRARMQHLDERKSQVEHLLKMHLDFILARIASVSVRLSARSRHFWLFGRTKIRASPKNGVKGEGKKETFLHSSSLLLLPFCFALDPIFARPKSEKCLSNGQKKPMETLAA